MLKKCQNLKHLQNIRKQYKINFILPIKISQTLQACYYVTPVAYLSESPTYYIIKLYDVKGNFIMLLDKLEKQPTKNEVAKKVKAWETLNAVLVKANSEFMGKLGSMLAEKQVQHEQLKEKIEKGEGTEEDNAEYLFLGGYVQCLKDILGAKPKEI